MAVEASSVVVDAEAAVDAVADKTVVPMSLARYSPSTLHTLASDIPAPGTTE